MLVVKYETDGLRLAGEVHLRRLLDRGIWRRSSDAMFGRTGSATRRWRCLTVEIWNDHLTKASLATIFSARCQWESAETDDVADLMVCYVIDESLVMCDWLHVLVLFPARPNYKSRFGFAKLTYKSLVYKSRLCYRCLLEQTINQCLFSKV